MLQRHVQALFTAQASTASMTEPYVSFDRCLVNTDVAIAFAENQLAQAGDYPWIVLMIKL